MAERVRKIIKRFRDNPGLARHYLVEALAPTDIAEVSRIARGSDLPPVHPAMKWVSRGYDALAVAGMASHQNLKGAAAVHLVFAKGAEFVSIGTTLARRKGRQLYRRYISEEPSDNA